MFVSTFLRDRSHFIRCKNMKKLTNYQGKPQYSTFFYAIIVCFRENYYLCNAFLSTSVQKYSSRVMAN